MECWLKIYLIGTHIYTLAQAITAVAEMHPATGPNLKYPTTHHQTTGRIKEAYRGPHTNGSHPYVDGDGLPLRVGGRMSPSFATSATQAPSDLNTAEDEAPKL